MTMSSRSFVKFSPALDRRRLAALMFTDIVGYSAIFHRDESLAMKLLGQKCDILRGIFPLYGGREIKTLGDGFFIEFPSVLEAVKCAYDIQSQLYQRNLGGLAEEKFQIRIGIHLCDFIATEEDAFGNDVNVSSRLEKIAPPGGICVSQQVVDQVSDKLELKFKPLKERQLKNIKRPVVSYSVELPWFTTRSETASVHTQLDKWIPKKITLQNGALFGSLALVALAGFILWAVFLMPQNALTDPKGLIHFLSSWKNLIVLNPIYAGVLWGMWMFQPQDRRLLYLSLVFSIGSLSLAERIPVDVTGLSTEALHLINLLAAALVPFPFVALEALEKDKRRNEIAANVGFGFFVIAAVFFFPRSEFANLRNVALAASLISTSYFLYLVGSKLNRAAPLPVNDLRRLLLVGFASAEIISQMSSNWNQSGIASFLDGFFPVAFPVYFTVFMVFGFVFQERQNRKKDEAGKVFHRISQMVCSADSYDEKLSNIQDQLCTFMTAERSTIYLVDLKGGDSSRLHAQAIYGPTNKLKEVALEIDADQGLIGRVLKTRSPLLIDDFKKDNRISTEERSHIKSNEYRTRSCLLCPLIIGNEILGVITFSDKRGNLAFNENDLRLVQLIAKDIALLSLHTRFQNMVDHFVTEKLSELNKVS